ncbi:MAG: tRNA dihydrouridine synthase DusB [Bdellovibrionales bacterium]|nr:tRNA dihydrouridine synthase DusB [Bdellovibrionales bacterium]
MSGEIQIGQHTYPKGLFLGPMEGITDVPFRKLVRKHGCAVTCTQMIHAQALIKAPDALRVMETSHITQSEKPVGFQLCGNDPEMVGLAAKIAKDKGAAFIDLNMGCPAKNVVNNGGGSALLQKPDLAAKIVESIRKHTDLPTTVKIRVGWTDDAKNHVEVGKMMENAGASLIAVHARTRSQKYTGKANWDLVKELKKYVRIPVVGNGDITTYQDIENRFNETKLDGVMIARGALGNPWIFSGYTPTIQERFDTLLEHLEDHLTFYGDQDRSYRTFRKHIVWYTTGLRDSAEFRDAAFKERDNQKFMNMLHEYFKKLTNES